MPASVVHGVALDRSRAVATLVAHDPNHHTWQALADLVRWTGDGWEWFAVPVDQHLDGREARAQWDWRKVGPAHGVNPVS